MKPSTKPSITTAVVAVLLAIPGSAQTTTKETTMTQLDTATAPNSAATAIRPFHVNIPEEQLVDLRRRIAATLA